MIQKWAFLISITMLTASCSNLLSSKPSGTLSESKMTEVLVDIHITEATLRAGNDSLSRLNDTADLRNRFALVFKKHNINPDDFNNSLNYYLEHIEELDKIYVEVINRLTELEASLQQKTVSPAKRTRALTNFEPTSFQLNNPWFRTLYEQDKPDEIQYFSTSVYPLKRAISPSYPRLK